MPGEMYKRSTGVCRAHMGRVSVQQVTFELNLEWGALAVWRWRDRQERLGEDSRLGDLVDQIIGQGKHDTVRQLLQFGSLLWEL